MDVHGSTVHGTGFQNMNEPFLIIFRAVLNKHFIVISLHLHKSIVLPSITMSINSSIASTDKDSSDCESMNTAMQIAVAQGDIIMSTTQGIVSRNTDNAPPPDVVEVAHPFLQEEELHLTQRSFLSLLPRMWSLVISRSTGSFNKCRMINAMIDPSVRNLPDWKKNKTAADMTEKRIIGEECLKQVRALYNDKEKCNEPVKEFSWASAKHDAGEFRASLDFKLTKHLTTVQDVHAKMTALANEYNQAYQKWKGKTTKRSGQHDVAKEPFEDMHFNTPWLVYCHSVAEKHPIFAQATRREFPPGVGVCSSNPRTAVKPPPQKKAKQAAPIEATTVDEELVKSSQGVAKYVAAILDETKKKNLRERKDNLAKQIKEIKKLANKAAAETSDDGVAVTQNSVKTDTTEFSAIKDLFSKENEKEQVELELEELNK
ncbi:hypothetical protein FisN_16Hu031 [Fistulifera solaris]|uniref:Uncharacterized protein n=1 Tax=Fistulifera solaris TaxID=1519565 RepID=A0A1Z5KGF9_FISSO|nr:hypothetical protein FisN_16Hu031 [Fistulifera solaris]|eukprot:GAX25192.1 hypothetical protein FisN_16Hu031 [Fistulifera solaris]